MRQASSDKGGFLTGQPDFGFDAFQLLLGRYLLCGFLSLALLDELVGGFGLKSS